jgi:hypothetical protein
LEGFLSLNKIGLLGGFNLMAAQVLIKLFRAELRPITLVFSALAFLAHSDSLASFSSIAPARALYRVGGR